VCVGTGGLLGTTRRGLLGTMKGRIKKGGDSARGAFLTKKNFRHILPLWHAIFYNISIPRETKFNSNSNCYFSFDESAIINAQ